MKIFFSAGEPSGDQHAAHLIDELRPRCPGLIAEGFGGPHMRDAGCPLLFELTTLAVMGFLRVIPMLAKFRRLVKLAEQHLDQSRPDMVVLVDFPGFNWWIARAAKRRGIPVYYYLPPQLWAWAPWRIRRVRRWVDHVICALPFEYEWYRTRGVRATWVGHPFFDQVKANAVDAEAVRALRSDKPFVIGLLPGSRNHEVDRNWPVMLETIRQVNVRHPHVRWVIGNYRDAHRTRCLESLASAGIHVDMDAVVGRTSEVIEAADCCLMVSGSISLELLARRTPGVVLYRVARTGRLASRVLMNCRFITLTNLIADKEVMPEFISHGNPATDIRRMAEILCDWIARPATLDCRRQSMAMLAGHAANPGATRRTADLLLLNPAVVRRPENEARAA